MPRKVKIAAGEVSVEAELNETDTAKLVWQILPVTTHASLWGEEIYFPIPLETVPESVRETVEIGAVAYWPPGQALCLFFGRTLANRGKEIRPYSPVNVIGRITGDSKVLGRVKEGDGIAVSQVLE